MTKKKPVITIDGPGGAGKSTIAKRVAESMGYRYLDTGAMYRGIAYAHRLNAPADMQAFLDGVLLRFSFDGATRVFLGEEDISDRIRTPEIALLASSLSQDARVRDFLTRIQRMMGEDGGVVVEGRDTGSVVFPDAEVKFYLDADLAERAKRRLIEQVARNEESDPEKVKRDIEKRDRDDSERAIAPLVRPEGAIYIDTTGKNIDEVVEIVKKHVERAAGRQAG